MTDFAGRVPTPPRGSSRTLRRAFLCCCCGACAVARVRTLVGQFVDELHDALRFLRRDAGETEKIFLIEIDNVVERGVATSLEHGDRRRRQSLKIRQLDVGANLDRLFLFRQWLEERRLTTALEPFATRVQFDFPLCQFRCEAHRSGRCGR